MPEYRMPSPTLPPVPNKTTLDLSADSATQALYKAAIGPLNRDYYLPIFSGYESTSKIALQWNTAASLYTLNWMIFRRLWSAALIYAGALATSLFVIFGVGRAIFSPSTDIELGLAIVILTLSFVVPGLFGNSWLHTDCRQRMARALSQTTSLAQACDRLAAESSSRNRFLGLIAMNLAAISAVAGHFLAGNDLEQPPHPSPLPVTETATVAKEPNLSSASPALPAMPGADPVPALAATVSVAETTPNPVLPAPPPPMPEPAVTQPVAVAIEAQPLKVIKPTQTKPAAEVIYYVNVGLFSNTDNAERVHQRLKDDGMAVKTDTLNMANGQRSRVRVGPYPTRLAADAAARSVRAMGLDAIVRQQ
ncbi:SPOR domain-containing protein [Rhodoferax sp. PAMC 29310]|uniref:SPOR domain-containing protein n=1 Tax=Rhodoferax sp. PAMC 29310 TaxID=2822760 RepID=UPI001B338AF4|nr:SPOR domain-containing protein [Rhodoferax sp. PAMC 29310]